MLTKTQKPLDLEALKLIFLEARTHNHWTDRKVSDELLQQIYEIAKMGATSANCSPLRVIFVKSHAAKEKLKLTLDAGNVEKTMLAPVTAIFAEDHAFYEKLPKLFPHADAKSWFVGNDKLINSTAFRNGTLQAAYFMIAARALGLDCGPMSGFDNKKVDEAFFAKTTWKSNFLCNLGYGDASKLHPRLPRLSFGECCKVL